MEIALFSDSYLPTRDGVATVVDGLARSLARRGHGVHLVVPQAAGGRATRAERASDGIELVRLRSWPMPLYGQYRQPILPSVLPLWFARGSRSRPAPDVVHLHTPGAIGSAGLLYARALDVPALGTFHTNLDAMQESVPAKWGIPTFFRLVWQLNLGVYWRCDRTTAPSAEAREALLTRARKPFRSAVEVVPNGIDLSRLGPGLTVPDWRGRYGLGRGPLVTYLGRLTIDKGVHRFLDALTIASKTTEFSALIGGTGPEAARVEERLRASPELARRVRYVGPVAEEEKAALLSQSDLFVLPSTSDTASVVVLEAMASGTPCLVPDRGGPAGLVEDGATGLWMDAERPEAIAAAIAAGLSDPVRRREMGERAAAAVRATASLERMVDRVEAIYHEMLAERA